VYASTYKGQTIYPETYEMLEDYGEDPPERKRAAAEILARVKAAHPEPFH
jgi:uncharacterized protein YdhG (YjbR/CyaY superfamily)